MKRKGYIPDSREICYKDLFQRKFIQKIQAPNFGTLGSKGNEGKKHFFLLHRAHGGEKVGIPDEVYIKELAR